MELKVQILSLLFSFVFGIIFSIFTNMNYRFLFCKSKIFQIIITIIYVLDFSLLYFLLLKKINEGIIHLYFLFAIALGYLFGYSNLSKYVERIKKKIKKVLKNVNRRKV